MTHPVPQDDAADRGRTIAFICLAAAMVALAAAVWIWGRPVKIKTVQAPGPGIFFRVNVNTADEQTLQLLPGVGPALAQKIVAERNKKPFESFEDLTRVGGIGGKTAIRLAPYVVFTPADRPGPASSAPPITSEPQND